MSNSENSREDIERSSEEILEETMREILFCTSGENLQDTADEILRCAMVSGNGCRDDMTVLAVGMWRA